MLCMVYVCVDVCVCVCACMCVSACVCVCVCVNMVVMILRPIGLYCIGRLPGGGGGGVFFTLGLGLSISRTQTIRSSGRHSDTSHVSPLSPNSDTPHTIHKKSIGRYSCSGRRQQQNHARQHFLLFPRTSFLLSFLVCRVWPQL